MKTFIKKIILKIFSFANKDLSLKLDSVQTLLDELHGNNNDIKSKLTSLEEEFQVLMKNSLNVIKLEYDNLKSDLSIINERQQDIIHTFNQNYGIPAGLVTYKKDIYNTVFCGDKFKILHANARFYNFGDNALAYGVETLFLRYFRNDCQFIKEDVHSTIFDKYKIEEINQKYDLLLIGGGGLIDTFSNPENEYMLFTINQDALIKLSLPMICFSWGFNNFQNSKLPTGAINNLKGIADKSASFSVRNDGSKERLTEYGFNFDEIPDPGFFCYGNHPKPEIDGEYVLIQLAYDAPKERFLDDNFVQNIIQVCKKLLKSGYEVILAPHTLPDIEICKHLKETVADKNLMVWNWYEIIREDNVSAGLGYYTHAKFVIAMRGHGQIIPIGMNVPVISIINHPKHLGLLKKIGQEDLSVKINDESFIEDIFEKIEVVEKNYAQIKGEYKKINKSFENEIEKYFSDLKNKVHLLE